MCLFPRWRFDRWWSATERSESWRKSILGRVDPHCSQTNLAKIVETPRPIGRACNSLNT